MLRIDNLTYRIGPRVLLEEVNASINAGDRVGLVGRNGTGKTTLLRLICGDIGPESGAIEVPRRWRIGITRQEAPGGEKSLIDTVLAFDAELVSLMAESETATDPYRIAEIHTRLADKDAYSAPSRAASILSGLGFDEAAQQRPCSSYSGGWRMRVALAGLLFTQPELLLLDEPTNHLDLEATLWLEEYLKHYPGTILMVSHDRDLLNRAVNAILHLENAKMTLYQGNYDRFESTRRMQLEQNEKLRAKQMARRAELEGFIARFRAKASKAKQAQSRIKMLERLQPIAEHHEEASIDLRFPEIDGLAPPLYALNHVNIGYGDRVVLHNISLRLDNEDRIGILGANGNGKSTLVKLLAGRLAPMSGDVSRSSKLRIGYFAQHQADELDLSVTPVVEMMRRLEKASEQQARNHLGRFGFTQQRSQTQIGKLSGGEKARLLFALMTLSKPHILLLDEPTNHLDMDTRESLAQAINAFEGAVVIISHDPSVIEMTADRLWLVEDGKVTNFEGDLDDYRTRTLQARDKASEKPQAQSGEDDRKAQRQKSAERRQNLAPLKKKVDQAAAKVTRLEGEKAKLAAKLADPKLYADAAKALEVQKEMGRIEKDLSDAEEAWMALEGELEQAENAA
ncbi:MAG: ABC-F family ATP-binding cassette domain-containing protein [Proteobacteria bacterium]|nr:ABC-F family ATP-binding cassette domain-containing protein [Pseudomonadota bacterium]